CGASRARRRWAWVAGAPLTSLSLLALRSCHAGSAAVRRPVLSLCDRRDCAGVVALGRVWASREIRARRGFAVDDRGPLGAATMAGFVGVVRAPRHALRIPRTPRGRRTGARPTRRP